MNKIVKKSFESQGVDVSKNSIEVRMICIEPLDVEELDPNIDGFQIKFGH